MNSLVELRELFNEKKIPVVVRGGWYFRCSNGDVWTMFDGKYFLNKNLYPHKKFDNYINSYKHVIRKAKKIRSAYECESD